MRTQFEMVCMTCGLEATVAGGERLGTSGSKFVTMYCHECNTLEDIYVGNVCDEPFELKVNGANPKSFIDKCPCCHGDSLTLWTQDEPCPCCGGNVECTGETVTWG